MQTFERVTLATLAVAFFAAVACTDDGMCVRNSDCLSSVCTMGRCVPLDSADASDEANVFDSATEAASDGPSADASDDAVADGDIDAGADADTDANVDANVDATSDATGD